jgi:Protein of unknown function (DUF1566)
VNFADGRVKGYPLFQPSTGNAVNQKMFVRYVRGKPAYGKNHYADNTDGTVTDRATGLNWQKSDDGIRRNWQDALAYCQHLLLGRTDNRSLGNNWRLPNAKEVQSIVDHDRAPVATAPGSKGGSAIDPVFAVTSMESYFCTSTTLLDGPPESAPSRAAYVAFGRALGFVQVPPGSGVDQLLDVHGAGSQRADPKAGNPAEYPLGFGPQGDDVRSYNHARCVRS